MGANIRRDGVRSFVLFTVGGMVLALPLDGVLEILRPPALVPIPLGPPSLEGLARRRGAVLPVIGLRRVLGLGAVEGEERRAARLLIVSHNGQPVGLLVDGVSGLSSVEEDRIADAGTAPDPSVDAELLAGTILAGDGRDGALILDPGPMIERQFADLGRVAGPAGSADFGAAPQPRAVPRAAAGTEARQDEEQLVILTVGGQEFSLPVAAVREVVPVPEAVTRVPRARTHLLGMMTLRDALLPLVGLRELFGLHGSGEAVGKGARGKVAVLRTAEGLVGVVVEDVREILRVPRGRIDPVPPLMAREAEFEDMDGIARLDGGTRLIPVLSAERLFRHGAGLAGETGREEEAAVAAGMAAGMAAEQADAFVVFRLAGAEYGLPVAAVQEVLRRPDAVTPLPNAPDFVSGVTTLRGAVLPLVAMRRLLRLPDGGAGERGRVVVIASGSARAGLLVDGMAGIVRIPENAVEPAPVVSQAQHRLIRRIGTLEDAGGRRMILLMDPAELLDMDQLSDLLAVA